MIHGLCIKVRILDLHNITWYHNVLLHLLVRLFCVLLFKHSSLLIFSTFILCFVLLHCHWHPPTRNFYFHYRLKPKIAVLFSVGKLIDTVSHVIRFVFPWWCLRSKIYSFIPVPPTSWPPSHDTLLLFLCPILHWYLEYQNYPPSDLKLWCYSSMTFQYFSVLIKKDSIRFVHTKL